MYAVRVQHGNVLGLPGWTTVVGALSALFDARLLPPAMLELDDLAATSRRIPWNSTAKVAARKDNSFFFSLSSYLYADVEQPEELDTSSSTFSAAAASVEHFNLPELLTDSKYGPWPPAEQTLQGI